MRALTEHDDKNEIGVESKIDADVLAIQRAYPRIYHACHVRHVRRATTSTRLSERDAAILAHMDRAPVGVGQLAKHLGVAASTLSEALDELERLGFVTRTKSQRDRRSVFVSLTTLGEQATADASVLDTVELERVLARLSPSERKAAVRGIAILARASVEHASSRRRIRSL